MLIGGVALGAILLLATIWLSLAKRQIVKDDNTGKSGTKTIEPGDGEDKDDTDERPEQSMVEPGEQQATHVASRVTFDTVTLPQSTPQTPPSVSLYRFSSYDSQDVDRMASALGLGERKTENGATIAYDTVDPTRRGWLMVDAKRGVLTYRFYGNQPQQIQATTATQRAQTFLNDLGVIDDLVDCSITYQKTAMPDVTMVECHRDWQRTGLPILNFTGLINVPESTPLASMKLGKSYEGDPNDPSIVNTSTGQDGYSRPSDFNTATVSVDDDGTILGFTSNIREISGTQKVAAADFVQMETVREKIIRGETNMFFIRPEGEGTVDWDAFFATSAGRGAQVTDLILAYVEIPGRQEYLAPMYIARGTAQMGNYRAVFFTADPATRLAVSANTLSGPAVAGVTANRYLAQSTMGDSPKLGTFGFVPAATVNVIPTGECLPGAPNLYPLIDLPPFGKVGKFTVGDYSSIWRFNKWFLVPASPYYDVLPEVNSVMSMFASLNLGSGKDDKLRQMDDLQQDWSQYSQCPIRLSGASPTIFVSGGPQTTVVIRADASVLYRKPTASHGAWNVTVQADGTLQVDGTQAPYLYYEYQPVSFTRPEHGWNVKRSQLMTFAKNTIAPALGLTAAEDNRLAYEIATATFGMTDETVYVAPIAQAEVDALLPLGVSGTENTVRIHFYVGSAQAKATAPYLTAVPRSQTMVLELGASQGK